MKHQIEKNKHILWEEMERLGSQKMAPDIAKRLGVYRDAYKALHMLCEDDAQPEGYHAHAEGHRAFTRDEAVEWVSQMKNEDGTTGPHWSMELTEQARKQRNIDCDPVQFFAAMNMMYSDYCKVAEKVGASSMDFYAYMAKAFLDDKDAADNKIGRYWACVVKR